VALVCASDASQQFDPMQYQKVGIIKRYSASFLLDIIEPRVES